MTDSVAAAPDHAANPKRRWRSYEHTWFLAVPTLLIVAVVSLFVWGEMQPRRPGFVPTSPDEGTIITDQ